MIRNASDPNGPGVKVRTKIKDIGEKDIKVKLMFGNPQFVSMSSQNEKDRVYFQFPENLVLTDEAGNGLLVDKG